MSHRLLVFFEYGHLPPRLALISAPFYDLAHQMAGDLSSTDHPAELAAGLRKLLEAKDCMVRAALTQGIGT